MCKGQAIGYNIFVCPNCEAVYCQKCTRTLENLENACWVCNAPFDESKPSIPFEQGKEDEEVIVVEDGVPKKGGNNSN